MKDKHLIIARVEQLFDATYMIVTFLLGMYMIVAGTSVLQRCWGIMALVLIFGDSFHLLPRIMSAQMADKRRYQKALGIGKMITSITMTAFYLFLWYIGMYIGNVHLSLMTILVWVLAIIRVLICLLPQNAWTSSPTNYQYGIYRNIPFLMQGLLTSWLYAAKATGLPWMWIAILLSFAFYIPVVLFADKKPKYGMFMLPKTCVYVWMVIMGLWI